MKSIIVHSRTAALFTGALLLATPSFAQSINGQVNGQAGSQSSYSNFGKTGSAPAANSNSSANISANSQSSFDSDTPRAEMEATTPSSNIPSSQNGSLSGNAGISSQSSFSNFGKVGSTPNGSVQ